MALHASGWPDGALARLIVSEDLWIGALGSLLGMSCLGRRSSARRLDENCSGLLGAVTHLAILLHRARADRPVDEQQELKPEGPGRRAVTSAAYEII